MAFRLGAESEAERQARDAKQREGALRDHAKRIEMSRKRVVITLEESPRESYAGNQGLVSFRGSEPGRSPLAAVYFKGELDRPSTSQEGAEDLDARLRDLERGDKVSLAGYWAKRQWQARDGSSKEVWEFKAQNFEKGDVSLDAIGKSAAARIDRIRPQGAAPAPEVEDEVDRDLARMLSDGGMGKPPASPRLSYVSGNVVHHGAQVLVNTVNSQLSERGNGVMGKGVAEQFKINFPSIMKDYEAAIRSGELKPGRALLFDLPDGRKWAALATKDHFSNPSQEKWVESGLKELGEKMREAGLTSVALPPPGCGNGGLDWKKVEPLVHRHLDGIDVAMFAKPSGAMEPAKEILPVREGRASAASVVDAEAARKAKALAALGGGAERAPARDRSGSAPAPANARAVAALGGSDGPKVWTEAEVVKAIPQLLAAAQGYKAYSGIGSRETPQDVADEMTVIARKLEARGLTMRSGGADKSKGVQPPNTKSADISFEEGITDKRNKEIFIPWKGFGKFDDGVLMDPSVVPRAREIAAAAHPGWDHCSDGAQKMHVRNVSQVYGAKLDNPVAFAMCWTKNGALTHDGPDGTNRDDGGTGQAIRIAGRSGIPVLNMQRPAIRQAILQELGMGPERGRGVEQEASNGVRQFDLSIPPVRTRARDDVASFCKTSEPLGGLAMMSRDHPYEDQGLKWKSSEAHFQAAKFPHNPDLQEQIRLADNGFEAKKIAWDNKDQVRPDWREINAHMLAYVNTRKMDGSQSFRDQLASTQGRDIVELSVKDDFFGAKPVGDKLVGRDLLGSVLTQLRDGARMDELPPGTSFPGIAAKGADRSSDRDVQLPEPSIKASMYFKYGRDRRPGFQSESTFDAILAGERTSTTRYKEWGSTERWEGLKPGSVARFYEDKDMRGRSVDVVVLGTQKISLREMDSKGLEDWSKVEGWSVEHARASARKYTEGVQIRYALPDSPEGRQALGLDRGVPQERERTAAPAARTQEAPARAEAPARPSQAQLAGMTQRDKWLAALG